ncbi:trypsin-like peptidase domain-containing protein [Maribacter sp. 2304DJ31-5]|uniref:trypsin-like peptidase domain-containing protein n=1 Tax=Maribacter sp. 2304DJ31-5 TaxID=3386273 RepID=UPI0039BC50CB
MKSSIIKKAIVFSLGIFTVLLYANTDTHERNGVAVKSSNPGNCIRVPNQPPNEENQAKQIQNRILELYDKLLEPTVRVQVGSMWASAVVVSEDGYILTAGHVIDAVEGKETNVTLSDDTVYKAICLGKDVDADYGLMKIETTKKLAFAEMGNADGLAKDETCLMFGHPETSEKGHPAIGRIGFYKGINKGDYLKTSCLMMPGDSGGPLFDLNGKLIGICSYIDSGLGENYYASIKNVKKNWNKLIEGKTFNNAQEYYDDSIMEAPIKNKPYVLKGGKKTLVKLLANHKNKIYRSIVTIESRVNEETVSTQGTIFNDVGYIVAKSSQIGDANVYCTLSNAQKIDAKVIGRNEDNDLVVLKIESPEKLQAINLGDQKEIKPGQLLGTISNNDNIIWAGMLGLGSRKISSKETGYLGIQFKESNNVIVESIVKNGPAEKAKLKAGDKIIAFNNTKIPTIEDLIEKLSKTRPNETVKITILRKEKEKKLDVVMGRRNPNVNSEYSEHPADQVKVSKIRDGFTKAFTHDMPLKLNHCGTPVFNLKGEVYGINIARKGRTCSLAIPSKQIEEIINTIL